MTTDERNAIAKELADLGRSDARHLAKLKANHARRCEILTSIVTHPDAGISGDVTTYATAPKEK